MPHNRERQSAKLAKLCGSTPAKAETWITGPRLPLWVILPSSILGMPTPATSDCPQKCPGMLEGVGGGSFLFARRWQIRVVLSSINILKQTKTRSRRRERLSLAPVPSQLTWERGRALSLLVFETRPKGRGREDSAEEVSQRDWTSEQSLPAPTSFRKVPGLCHTATNPVPILFLHPFSENPKRKYAFLRDPPHFRSGSSAGTQPPDPRPLPSSTA